MKSVTELAANYKFIGMNKFRAWDQYVIDTGLKPRINAKDFYNIYEVVTPEPYQTAKLPDDFRNTRK